MAILRNNPYPGLNFLVDLGTGVTDGPETGLAEVIFPEARLQTLGTGMAMKKKIPPARYKPLPPMEI